MESVIDAFDTILSFESIERLFWTLLICGHPMDI